MTCDFTSFLTVFQSYQDDVWMIMKGCVQWNSVYGWEDFTSSENRTRSARSVGQRLTHWATGAPKRYKERVPSDQGVCCLLLNWFLGYAVLQTLGLLVGCFGGAPVAHPNSRRNLLNRKRRSNAHSLSLSSKHRPYMTEILLKRT